MKAEESIRKICKELEREHNITVLFAVESGSRAWGVESRDSDYDVRFVFKRPLKEYISIHLPGDVITAHYDKEGKKSQAQGCCIDACGFDVFKFSRMLASSNPTTIEWLQTNILYYGERPTIWESYAENQFNPISIYHHYKAMCRQNYRKYLKSGKEVTYKKVLYAMRGLINAKLIATTGLLPFIDFNMTLKHFKEMNAILLEKEHDVPNSILKKLEQIVRLKKEGNEQERVENIGEIESYIEDELADDSGAPTEKRHGLQKELDKELRNIILGKGRML